MENLREIDEAAENEAIVLLNLLMELEWEFPILVARRSEILERAKLAEIQKSLLRFANLQLSDAIKGMEKE